LRKKIKKTNLKRWRKSLKFMRRSSNRARKIRKSKKRWYWKPMRR
jgi:hypothetical protein